MSVQFGRWNFEGQTPAPDYVEKVSATLAPYGPDSDESYSKDGIRILYRAFHTTKESRRETQPHISLSGAVITWDGRLDNHADLISELRDSLTIASTDVAIVAAAYDKWGTHCFAKLIGDWALSIWNPVNRSLILAKDPIGLHHLFYSFDSNHVTWSTILDPLVLFAGKTFLICEEYIAGWFSHFPAPHLTPYLGLHSVPPSSWVLLRPRKHTVDKYWDFDPSKKIRYRTDAEYEEHFRAVFAKAVQRRLRSDSPILAELSGGMDSSSIVCMADTIIARGAAETPRLDTISWYDDSYDHIEPDTNELHWINKVEEKRGRTGYHMNLRELKAKEVVSQKSLNSDFASDRFAAVPIPGSRRSEIFHRYGAYMKSVGHRVVFSGLAGESATGGGVPSPTPELQNLIARARFGALAHQLKAWAAKMRKRRLPLLWEAARGFFSATSIIMPKYITPATWFHPGFVHRNHMAICGYPSRVKLFGPLPSFQENVRTLDAERSLLAFYALPSELLREVRYPYVDRSLLEFMYAIPREQIVRVGQRRALMKRALAGIVPDELLNRRRKPFVPPESKEQAGKKGTSTEWPRLVEIGRSMISSSIGIVNPDRFFEALQKVQPNEEVLIDSFTRALILESWLRHLTSQGVLTNSMAAERQDSSRPLEAKQLQASAQPKSSAS